MISKFSFSFLIVTATTVFPFARAYPPPYAGCFTAAAKEGPPGFVTGINECENTVLIIGVPYADEWSVRENGTTMYYCRARYDAPDPRYLSAIGRSDCKVDTQIINPPGEWTWGGCYNISQSPDSSSFDWFPVADFRECLTRCTPYPQAYSKYNSDFTVSCLCSTIWPDVDILDCYYDEPFFHYHTVQPSSFAKRRSNREGQHVLDLCPAGSRACSVPESDGESYECIDIDIDFESCGGCAHGDFGPDSLHNTTAGVDCTALPGVSFSGVSCYMGSCQVVACEEGYNLIDGQCLSV
ncbi:hypothetical protein I302_105341 [Kwoniella bestiolae CBS 10118]|uniref:Protein CPL1-like domain-containing protein n=1 Tax=Kwoniella bestiolae CBS 10118 TaxID=1296100 RepID=A0A1B9FSV6_9TREE|nr:hypothetical protein I302_08627 [Kwoniella bestiolae CBS 10118]OCF21848.1 hypothetical protein I302_08627 [Kwoniella bestiolae CBS 10118]